MIATVIKNWKEIKRMMELSQDTEYNWFEYSIKINNGLSNHCLTKKGCGDVIWFVQRLNEYAHLSNEYLKYGIKMNDKQIDFINQNRNFLKSIK